jgi:hypothetical protein
MTAPPPLSRGCTSANVARTRASFERVQRILEDGLAMVHRGQPFDAGYCLRSHLTSDEVERAKPIAGFLDSKALTTSSFAL